MLSKSFFAISLFWTSDSAIADPSFRFCFYKCLLPAEAADDDGEVVEEVVADHAFVRDECLFCVLLALSGLVNSGR